MIPDPVPGRVVNEGSSADRTRFSWRRTVLAITAVALLTIRVAVHDDPSAADAIAIVAVCAGWFIALRLAQRRIRAMAKRQPPEIGRSLPAMALLVAGFAILGIALVAMA
jgi:hypothetical protein